jgi:hypothetical protein
MTPFHPLAELGVAVFAAVVATLPLDAETVATVDDLGKS